MLFANCGSSPDRPGPGTAGSRPLALAGPPAWRRVPGTGAALSHGIHRGGFLGRTDAAPRVPG
jgi:hypothetical protein